MCTQFVFKNTGYYSHTVKEEDSIDACCAAELLHNEDITSLPTSDLCDFICKELHKPLSSMQDLSMSMQLYWLYCTLTVLNPQTAEGFRQKVINTLQSWVSPQSGLVTPHDGYQAHALIIFGATLSAVAVGYHNLMDRETVHSYLTKCFNKQLGCFCSDDQSQENDVRVSYTCVSVGYCYNLLGDETLFGEQLIAYFLQAQAYDGGSCSNNFGGESHGAYTFCSLASLYILLGCSSAALRDKLGERRVLDLLLYIHTKQTNQGGFAGRNNKLVDGCYTYWMMGSLYLLVGDGYLEDFMVIDANALYRYVLRCSYNRGSPDGKRGMRDKPGVPSDAYHNMYTTAGYLILLKLVDLDANKTKYSPELLAEVEAQRELFMRHDPLFNIPIRSADTMKESFPSILWPAD